jgi:glutamate dehydrogenase/leucine dehydrogenase
MPVRMVHLRSSGTGSRSADRTRSVRRVSTVTEQIASRGHEQVVFVADAASGLRAIIAIHSTALGPSLGGVRFWKYPDEDAALADVLRLSEAMTRKAAVAGLHQGGGKAVVLVDDPDALHSEAVLRALGRSIDDLGGRFLAAEDVGATPGDMDTIAIETRWVTGVAPAAGGSGDPSPMTAAGVIAAMRAVGAALDGEAGVAGRRVAIQGAGHVGAHLVEMLTAASASVVVADVNAERAAAVAAAYGAETIAAGALLAQECDILAPCALGGSLSQESVPRLRCRAVCGAANNQLADESVGVLLQDRAILYAPDFVTNAGGIINIAEEFTGYDRARALARVARIEQTVRGVFERSRDPGVTPEAAAVAMADERLAREGAERRWRPGDPTAWTDGAPLERLRP